MPMYKKYISRKKKYIYMKDLRKPPKVLNSPVWEFFFQLIFLSPASDISYWLFVVLEKLLFLSPACMYIFKDSSWKSLYNFFDFFNVYFLMWHSKK